MAAHLPRAVEDFVVAHLRSVEELQLLVRLVDEPDRWWDPEAVSQELHVSPVAAEAALEWFAARNLLEIRVTTVVRYRFNPGIDSLRQNVQDSVAAYKVDPIAVIRVISPELQHIRDFADAFRIKGS